MWALFILTIGFGGTSIPVSTATISGFPDQQHCEAAGSQIRHSFGDVRTQTTCVKVQG